MPVNPQDRPIETLREEVIDQLVMNYSHGVLSLEAFERRLDDAMETSDHNILTDLTADLDLKVDQDYIDNKKDQMYGNYVPGDAEDVEYMFQIFSGNDRSGVWSLPKELRMVSIFSGAKIDLSEAKFCSPVVRIKLMNLFSGIDIAVSENINVRNNTFCIFGGVNNGVVSNAGPNAPTVIIEGVVLFSGVKIKIKRTIKERFVVFADKLKTLLS